MRAPAARAYTYETPMGYYRVLVVREAVDVHLCDACARVEAVNAAVAEFEREVPLSDVLSDELGIQILSAGAGLWRHVSDTAGIERRSAEPEYW